ncbi:MAG: hypothetical protein JWO85_294 [Candidatus Eremiobacteraeota bacterium]|jgi:hypothetical protein|nr:hypothetical protein [Candidatus Eremiobacteraeota bacterium]
MTVTDLRGDVAEAVEKAASRLTRATAAYIARLKDIADVATLSRGSHGFDYAVSVSHADKPGVLPLLADLTFEIENEFGVTITTLAVATGPVVKAAPASRPVRSRKRRTGLPTAAR